MSWFKDLPERIREQPGEAAFDGVMLERREVLMLSLGALAALGLGRPQGLRAGIPRGALSWEGLLSQTSPLAEKLVRQANPDEDAYLAQIAALLPRVNSVPEPPVLWKLKSTPAVLSLMLHDKLPVVVMQFKLLPGAAIPYHDHRDYNGALMGLSGEAHVRSFEIAGPDKHPPAGSAFQIHETRRVLLKPGRVATLSRTRDNIHDVRAGKDGARLLDFFTFFQPDGTSVYLHVDERRRHRWRRIYDATWT